MAYLLGAVASGIVAFGVGVDWLLSMLVVTVLLIAARLLGLFPRLTDVCGPASLAITLGAAVGWLLRSL